jgi:hypothetical protein
LEAILSVLSSIAALSTVCPSAKDRSRDCLHSERKSDWVVEAGRRDSRPWIAGGSSSAAAAWACWEAVLERDVDDEARERVDREEEEELRWRVER